MKYTLKKQRYEKAKITRTLVRHARAAGRWYFLLHQMLAAGYAMMTGEKGIYVFKKKKTKKLIRKLK